MFSLCGHPEPWTEVCAYTGGYVALFILVLKVRDAPGRYSRGRKGGHTMYDWLSDIHAGLPQMQDCHTRRRPHHA